VGVVVLWFVLGVVVLWFVVGVDTHNKS
jgi:hypothetical protein